MSSSFFLIIGLLYFAPAVYAFIAGHKNKVAILVLNLFLGWTFLGWIASLVWSCTKDKASSGV